MRLRTLRTAAGASVLALLISGCGFTGDDTEPVDLSEQQPLVPEFFDGEEVSAPDLTVIADSSDGIDTPNDLEFHPAEDRQHELWVLNEEYSSFSPGGTTVTLFDAGGDDQEAETIKDGNAAHFMAKPTSLAFAGADTGKWATGVGVQDANHGDGTFAGPSLWSSDFEIYGNVGDPPTQDINGSHLDMLHGSPFSMGIAHEEGNAYWVYDGYHGYMVRYDFYEPHPPGGSDHSDGRIYRHKDVEIERHDELPSHMIVDHDTGWLYINDTGNQRVLRLDIDSGDPLNTLGDWNEPLTEHMEMTGTKYEVFADGDLDDPTGIALNDGRLFVSNHGTSEVIAFDTDSGDELARIDVDDGVRGMTIGPDENLWLASYDSDEILRVDP